MMLGQRQKQSFAEQGYVVVPQAVPRPLVADTRREFVQDPFPEFGPLREAAG